MATHQLPLTTFYRGWDVYQHHLVTAIAPLTPEQLTLRPALHMWSLGMLATHIIATRASWLHMWMGQGSADLAPLTTWDEDGQPARSATELVAGLERTWQMIQDMLAHLTPGDLEQLFPNPYAGGEDQANKRQHSGQWIVWHVLEHDIHHGGELSLILGMHGLAAMDL